jgi:hypothetical protein
VIPGLRRIREQGGACDIGFWQRRAIAPLLDW